MGNSEQKQIRVEFERRKQASLEEIASDAELFHSKVRNSKKQLLSQAFVDGCLKTAFAAVMITTGALSIAKYLACDPIYQQQTGQAVAHIEHNSEEKCAQLGCSPKDIKKHKKGAVSAFYKGRNEKQTEIAGPVATAMLRFFRIFDGPAIRAGIEASETATTQYHAGG